MKIMKYPDDLTAREMEVLGFVVRGFPVKLIAAAMGISENTVNTYLRDMRSKTDVHNMRELMLYGLNIGFNREGVYTPAAA